MPAPFDLLSPAMQFQIVNGLGFSSLRPVQELAIAPVVAGKNCVVLAPTAGGKTEAAFFPLLSQMDRLDWRPLSLLYVAPIKALLNDQEHRLSRYAALLGRRAAVWHGDVGPGQRRAFLAEPSDLLLTTPESLEVMLMSPSVPARRLFATLRAVVVDEAHAFAGDDRGVHLAAVLERLARISGHDLQRIALSATVGNPEAVLGWLAGGSRREGEVICAPAAEAAPEVALDFVANHANAARVVMELHPGSKRLVFVDSRRGVEQVGSALRQAGLETFVTHSSLALDERRGAERAFAEGRNCAIVATSALELGIDIGDLDYVYQVGCPSTVAAFLQRMGRSGRRPGTRANFTFLALDDDEAVQAAALLRLHARGFVEAVRLPRRAYHVLAHQLIALALQEGGLPAGDAWGWIGTAAGFGEVSAEERQALVDHMLREEILHLDGGRLSLGRRGEQLYGFRHFMELYAVFSSPRVYTVMHGAQEIGTVEATFIHAGSTERVAFTLGARTWAVLSIDAARGVLRVEPALHSRHARWSGRPVLLGPELCNAVREVLTDSTEDAAWTRRARARIAQARAEHEFLEPTGETLVQESGGYRLWNFAGGRHNNVLAGALEGLLGENVTTGNLSVGFRDGAGRGEVAIRQALDRLRTEGRPSPADALAYAEGLDRVRLSKFQPCLPRELEVRYLAEALT